MTPSARVTLHRPPRAVRLERTAAAPGGPAAAGSEDAMREMLEACRAQAHAEVEAQLRELAQSARALRQAAGEVRRLEQDLLAQAEEQLLELSLEIARKVLMQEIQAGRYHVEPIVKAALARLGPAQEVVVRLNGADLARCRQADLDAGEGVRLLADPGVGPGECIVQTAEGVVESRIPAHLQEISQALRALE